MKVYIIGAGGTASYLLPALIRSISIESPIDEVIIIDRDELEEKNVERQLYNFDDVGKSKAGVVAASLKEVANCTITALCEWFEDRTEVSEGSFIISCTDNHPARLAVLEKCDLMNCRAVICGNEDYSADAYYYEPSFKDTPMDPRVRYAEILTDKTDDPTRPPCDDEDALQASPQLAAANFMSASCGLHLVQLWLLLIDDYDQTDLELRNCLPIEYSVFKTGINTVTRNDLTDVE